MKQRRFGKMPSGEAIQLFTLANKNGIEAEITNFGGIVVSLKTPDRAGKFGDVTLGYDALEGYLEDRAHFGGIIGRFANRIAQGKFSLNGKQYTVAKNDGENHLHGGIQGFDKVVWRAKDASAKGEDALQLEYLSADGEEGYPGNLKVRVTYSLNAQDELKMEYGASTDRDTVVNLTNHSYFNLVGGAEQDVLRHQLLLNAERFTPVSALQIPTGELQKVDGTVFDFRIMTEMGARISRDDEQLKYGGGYDHNWVVRGQSGEMRVAARVYEPESGRTLEVRTTEPGIQFYSGNFLDGTVRGKRNELYSKWAGFCLETQHFPDSPNHPEFPSTVLKPREEFRSVTIFKFGVETD